MVKPEMTSIKEELHLKEKLISDYYNSLYGKKEDSLKIQRKMKEEKLTKLKKKFSSKKKSRVKKK